MNTKAILTEAIRLSVPERVRLVGDIWETVAAVPDAIALSGPQKRELDRRLETYRRNPGAAIPWKDVLSELRRKG